MMTPMTQKKLKADLIHWKTEKVRWIEHLIKFMKKVRKISSNSWRSSLKSRIRRNCQTDLKLQNMLYKKMMVWVKLKVINLSIVTNSCQVETDLRNQRIRTKTKMNAIIQLKQSSRNRNRPIWMTAEMSMTASTPGLSVMWSTLHQLWSWSRETSPCIWRVHSWLLSLNQHDVKCSVLPMMQLQKRFQREMWINRNIIWTQQSLNSDGFTFYVLFFLRHPIILKQWVSMHMDLCTWAVWRFHCMYTLYCWHRIHSSRPTNLKDLAAFKIKWVK